MSSIKLYKKRRELLADPNWTEEFPRQDSPNMVHDGICRFCPCGNYHPIWFLEPKKDVQLDDDHWVEYTICPESDKGYPSRPRPLMPNMVKIPYAP